MPNQEVKLVITADDKTQQAILSTGNGLKYLEGSVTKLSIQFAALATAWNQAMAVVRKGMEYIDLGSKALKAEEAFGAMAEAGEVNAGRLRAAMKKAADGMVDDSDLMQKAAFAMAQDIDPNRIPQLLEAARIAARKTGKDVGEAIDGMIQGIATNMPRSLRQMGAITKEQMSLLNKAAAEGVTEINLLDLVLANAAVDAAKLGTASNNAAKDIARFNVEIKDLKETVGKGMIVGLQAVLGVLQGIAGFALGSAAGLFKLVQGLNALGAYGANKVGMTGVAKTFQEQAERWKMEAAAADAAAFELYKRGEKNIYGSGPDKADTRSPEQKKADIAKAEAVRDAAERKLRDAATAKERLAAAEKAQKEKERLDGLWIVSEGAKMEAADEIGKKYFEDRKEDAEKLNLREMELFDETEKANADYLKKMPADLKAAREGEISSQLAELDIAEAGGKAHAATLADRIRLTGELKTIQESFLSQIDRLKDPTGWNTQQKAIDETRLKLLGLNNEQTAATGSMFEGFSKGWTEWINNARTTFTQGKDLATSTAGAMNTSFSDIFFDAWTGKLQSAGDYFRSFATSILRAWANMCSEMIARWLMVQAVTGIAKIAGGVAAGGMNTGAPAQVGADMGGGATTAYGMHGGGVMRIDRPAFFRIVPASLFLDAPRYHGGIGPGEKPAIIRDDEGIFTPGQMKAMGGGAGTKIEIANIVSPELLDSYLATPRGQNAILNVITSRPGVVRRMLRGA